MAIDTQAERASVLGIVQPDGTIGQADRQTVLDIYGGILAAALGYIVGELHMTFGTPLSPAGAFAAPLAPASSFGTPLAPSITFGE